MSTVTGAAQPGGQPAAVVVDAWAWGTLAVASIASFMVSLEITIISLAFGKIRSAFPETSLGTLSWVFTAYNIGVASLLLIAGWLSDTRGRKRCFLLGLFVFGAGSILSGVAWNASVLITGRVVQSVGGALLNPAGLALILTAFPRERRQAAVGIWGISGGLAAAVGPTLGAMLVESAGWRAVFLINVPIAFLGIPIGLKVMRESRAEHASRRVDLIGIPLASFSVGVLVLAIVQGADWGWTSSRTIGCVVASVALAVGFVRRAVGHPAPLFDLALYRIRSYRIATIGSVLFTISFFGWLVQLPNFLQSQWGYSVLKAGFAIAPGPALTTVLTPLLGRFTDRLGHRRLTAMCSLIGAAGLAWSALVADTSSNYLIAILPQTLAMGVTASTGFAIMVGAAMRDIPDHRFGMAGAGRNTAFQLGIALSIAISVAVVGRPAVGQAMLDAHRRNWLLGAAVMLALAVLFAIRYPAANRDH